VHSVLAAPLPSRRDGEIEFHARDPVVSLRSITGY
jgi:hypothetical protein